jgi:hypothetical protein
MNARDFAARAAAVNAIMPPVGPDVEDVFGGQPSGEAGYTYWLGYSAALRHLARDAHIKAQLIGRKLFGPVEDPAVEQLARDQEAGDARREGGELP